ncbi:hypothetical protein KPH14_001794 [Odynerus spinipes]|uniref:NF-kappa-B essential modulator NEMO N-terminal domain-containing protein n=1 Tax=Odynerus spinipes TaxID=1348599 RepID=A0AAD9RZT7_9HYME|nr:hypothetical protein KPH14_001794 [Odynerus spinipes]
MDSQQQEASTSDFNDFIDVSHKSNIIAKPDLESLGFVINNGKPRFKLDEPISTTFYPKIELTKTDHSLDDSDTLSFVILGKKSLDSIQASSLATYTDIQRKCMSIDYNSIISSLNSSEIQKKLTELLQENVKLKETLKQNTTAMKQQFNTLATWQEEVMNVHKHHKQKFAETRHLINLLKQENAELKLKLSTVNADDAISGNTKEIDNSIHLNQLHEKVSSLSDEINGFKFNCAQLSEDFKKCINFSHSMNAQPQELIHTKEEQDPKINKPETGVITDQVKEISKLSSLLEDEIKSLHTSINLNMEQMSDHVISPQSHYFTQSIKQYGEMLQELTECFITQIARFSSIQKCIKECINILDACENIKLPEKCDTIEESWSLQLGQLQIYKEKLSIYQKMLLEEQLKLLTDRQSFIKLQNQFQKIFSDYNSIWYELQIMSEENAKLHIMKDSITRESSQRITELEKCKNESEEKYKEVKDILEQERQSWNEQKRSLDNQRKSLNMEYKCLIDQKEMLFSLHEEKTLTSKQCQLHDTNEKLLQMEKDTLEKNYKQLITDVDALHVQLEKKDSALQILRTIKEEQDRKIEQQEEKMELLKTQLLFYEEDFNSEKSAKEKLLLEKSELQQELQNAYIIKIGKEVTMLNYKKPCKKM